MSVTIIEEPLILQVYGLSGIAVRKDYVGKAFQLMDVMWKIVKGQGLRNKGRNIWVYDAGDHVFAGVEMEEVVGEVGLEKRDISLLRYAYHKHVGPYSLIRESGMRMRSELEQMGLKAGWPYIEIYGHWEKDERKLETELIIGIVIQ